MKEDLDFNTVPDQEKTILLHNQEIVLDNPKPLRTIEESRKEGINGEIITEIEVPTMIKGTDILKKIALVDFGEDIPKEGRALIYYPPNKSELIALGVTHSRYALMGLNYHPDDLLAAVNILHPNYPVTIGRDPDNHVNYRLGLSEAGQHSKLLSREHLSIEIKDNHRIIIKDHSTNGTEITLPN